MIPGQVSAIPPSPSDNNLFGRPSVRLGIVAALFYTRCDGDNVVQIHTCLPDWWCLVPVWLVGGGDLCITQGRGSGLGEPPSLDLACPASTSSRRSTKHVQEQGARRAAGWAWHDINVEWRQRGGGGMGQRVGMWGACGFRDFLSLPSKPHCRIPRRRRRTPKAGYPAGPSIM